MHSQQLLTHVLFFVICATAVVCLKKDGFYCQLSPPCTCITINDDRNINLDGINLTLNITNNQTLNYQPCLNNGSGIIVSIRRGIRLYDKYFLNILSKGGFNFTLYSCMNKYGYFSTFLGLKHCIEELSEFFYYVIVFSTVVLIMLFNMFIFVVLNSFLNIL
jgi:hypothetical protein